MKHSHIKYGKEFVIIFLFNSFKHVTENRLSKLPQHELKTITSNIVDWIFRICHFPDLRKLHIRSVLSIIKVILLTIMGGSGKNPSIHSWAYFPDAYILSILLACNNTMYIVRALSISSDLCLKRLSIILRLNCIQGVSTMAKMSAKTAQRCTSTK